MAIARKTYSPFTFFINLGSGEQPF